MVPSAAENSDGPPIAGRIAGICQGACKPGSVAQSVSLRTAPAPAAIPLGATLPQRSSNQPGRSGRNTPAWSCDQTRRPYSVLLRVGFAMPPLLPAARCALTAPFHPYSTDPLILSLSKERSALCGTFPGLRSKPLVRRALPATLVSWSPDFPRHLRDAAARPPGVGEFRDSSARSQPRMLTHLRSEFHLPTSRCS